MFEKFLNHLVKNIIIDDSTFEYLISEGVSSSDWPDGEAKKQLNKFKELVAKRSIQYARYEMLDWIQSVVNENEFPDSAYEMTALYKKLLNDHRVKGIIYELTTAPEKLSEILLKHSSVVTSEKKYRDIVSDDSFNETIRLSESNEALRMIVGFENLSKLVGGFNPGRVGMLIARTGFGKTNFAVSLAVAISKSYNVLFANMEMIAQDFYEKMMMCACKISFDQLKKKPRDRVNDVINFRKQLSDRNKNIYYTEGGTLSVDELRSFCLKIKKTTSLEFLIVDYDQKIEVKTSRDTPEWKALQIAVETLEKMAKDLNIYILLLAQEVSGDVGASKRSKNATSVVLRFAKGSVSSFDKTKPITEAYAEISKNNDVFYLQAIKNRFGPSGYGIEVEYKPEMALVLEKGRVMTYEEIQSIEKE